MILEEFWKLAHRWDVLDSYIVDFYQKCGLLRSLGFSGMRCFTHVLLLDLPDEEIWTKRLSKKARNQTRLAQKKGVQIEEINSDCLDLVYEMICETSKRHMSVPYPSRLYENIFKIMKSKSLVKWLVARYEGKPIATSMFFAFKDSLTYWTNASLEEFRNLQPNNLLLWEMIRWGCKNGFRSLNMGASPLEAVGLTKFKESWGARRYEYVVYDRSSSLFRFLYRGRKILRRH
jgi:lipid II:glycine glycyltransferase (peptidoglycan interpeptide bridge formation enzyme)